MLFLLTVAIVLGVYVVQVARNKVWYRHLTHWTWAAHGFVLLGLLAEWWEKERAYFRDSLLNIGSNLSGGIVGGMAVLYAMDPSMLEQAAKEYGRATMEAGNILLHFAPLPFYWLVFLFKARLDTKYMEVLELGDTDINSAMLGIHFYIPCTFFLVYGSLFSPREEYGKHLSDIAIAFTIVAATAVNHLFFTQILVGRINRSQKKG